MRKIQQCCVSSDASNSNIVSFIHSFHRVTVSWDNECKEGIQSALDASPSQDIIYRDI